MNPALSFISVFSPTHADMTMIRWVRILRRSGRPVPNFPFSTLQDSPQTQFNPLFPYFLSFFFNIACDWWWSHENMMVLLWRYDDVNSFVKSSSRPVRNFPFSTPPTTSRKPNSTSSSSFLCFLLFMKLLCIGFHMMMSFLSPLISPWYPPSPPPSCLHYWKVFSKIYRDQNGGVDEDDNFPPAGYDDGDGDGDDDQLAQ